MSIFLNSTMMFTSKPNFDDIEEGMATLRNDIEYQIKEKDLTNDNFHFLVTLSDIDDEVYSHKLEIKATEKVIIK